MDRRYVANAGQSSAAIVTAMHQAGRHAARCTIPLQTSQWPVEKLIGPAAKFGGGNLGFVYQNRNGLSAPSREPNQLTEIDVGATAAIGRAEDNAVECDHALLARCAASNLATRARCAKDVSMMKDTAVIATAPAASGFPRARRPRETRAWQALDEAGRRESPDAMYAAQCQSRAGSRPGHRAASASRCRCRETQCHQHCTQQQVAGDHHQGLRIDVQEIGFAEQQKPVTLKQAEIQDECACSYVLRQEVVTTNEQRVRAARPLRCPAGTGCRSATLRPSCRHSSRNRKVPAHRPARECPGHSVEAEENHHAEVVGQDHVADGADCIQFAAIT